VTPKKKKKESKNCRKVKLSSCWSIAGDHWNLSEKIENSSQYKNNNRSNRGPPSNFSTTQNHVASFFFFFFSPDGRCTPASTIHQPLQTTLATTEQAGQHHRTPKHNQNLFSFSFFFFSPEECSGHHETRKKKTAIEIYEGTACVG
jgi:hypothetical protein